MRKLGLSLMVVFQITIFPGLLQAFDLLRSENSSLTLEGYAKMLAFTSRDRFEEGERFHALLNRLRLQFDGEIGEYLSGRVAWDHEMIIGSFVSSTPFDFRQTQRNAPYFDLDYEISRKEKFFYGQNFYRAYLKFDSPHVVVRVGRQRIDWGVARFFSPANLFSPLTIFNVEGDEIIGVDGALVRLAIGDFTNLQLVHTIAGNVDEMRNAAKISHTVGPVDIDAILGRFFQDWISGVTVAGNLWDMGWRGELTYNRSDFDDDFIQAAVGADYAWANSLYLALEYFFNGQARDVFVQVPFVFFQTSQPIKTQFKHFINLVARYDITPLIQAQAYFIIDVKGGSAHISPEAIYNILQWADLRIGSKFFFGQEDAEFTAVPHSYYLELKMYF